MIIFESLWYKNILSCGNEPIEWNLNSHKKTLIIGSNGKGKSNMITALSFGMFGKSDRGNKAQLINSINKKELEVRVTFSKGNDSYRIIRGISPNIFEIYKNDVLINQDASSRDYQKYLEDSILGINYKSFFQTVVLASSSFVPFMQLPSHARREIIEDLLHLDVFSRMKGVLKARQDETKTSLKDLEGSIRVQKEKLKQHQEYKKMLEEETAKRKDEIAEKIASKKKERQDSLKKAESIRAEMSTIADELEKAKESLAEHESTLEDLKSNTKQKAKDLKEQETFFSEHDYCPTCAQSIDGTLKEKKAKERTREQKIIKTNIEMIEAMTDVVKGEQNVLKKAQRDFQQKWSDFNEHSFTASSLESDIDDLMRDEKKIVAPSFNESEEDIYEELIQLEEAKSSEQELMSYLNSCGEMLKDSAMKGVMIRQFLPVINNLLNKYLSVLDFFVSFHFDENFDETVLSRHRDRFTYKSFSEGEKARIDLAILFTWRQIAKMKNSTSSNLLILDEVMDSSLDAAGIEALFQILSTGEETSNIFVITHSETVQQMEFDRRVQVVKDRNFSRLVHASDDEDSEEGDEK